MTKLARDQSIKYQDFANAEPATGEAPSGQRVRAGDCFPVRLHVMLTQMEKDNLSHIVSWQPHGRCFMVHKRDLFVKQILPLYFKHSKLSSFQRQLNLYSFIRISSGPDKGGYFHELFLRGKAFLARKITRTTIKGNGGRKPDGPETEPNFYFMTPLPSSKSLPQVGANAGTTNALEAFSSSLPSPMVPTRASAQSNGTMNIAALPNAIAEQMRMDVLSSVLANALAVQPASTSLRALLLLSNRAPRYPSSNVIGDRSAVASRFASAAPATIGEDPRVALLRQFYK